MKTIICSKTTLLLAWALVFIFACYPDKGKAQNAPTVFAIVDFMKVKPENEAKYLDVEKNIWKPLHQERANQGKIAVWALYKVLYSGTDDPYNYVTVTLFENEANLGDPWKDIDAAKILKGRDLTKDMEETDKSREMVKSHLIRMLDEVVPQERTMEDQYIIMDFMKVKPGNETAYLEVEKNIWRPVHQEFIKAGSRVGWSLWGEVFPAGTSMDYQFMTANYVMDFSKVNAADYNAAFSKVHADKDMDELNKKTNDSRELVRSELWQIVDMVMKQ